jgi:hypothetical protein
VAAPLAPPAPARRASSGSVREDTARAARPPTAVPPLPAATPAEPRLPSGTSTPPVDRAALERRTVARPLDADAHLQLGLYDLDGGAVERALGSLRRATFLAPDDALAHYSLGRAWQRLGDTPRARAALLHARRLLAALADETATDGAPGLQAGALRHSVDLALRAPEGPPPASHEGVQ